MLDACLAHGVRRIVVSSSGAAYGYHADNPEWLTEDDPVRGNEVFAYSHHKRLVEEMLAARAPTHPELEQVVLRIGTILGERVDNQITALFERPRLLKIRGSSSPFVFIWDTDVVAIIMPGGHRAGHRRLQRRRRRHADHRRDRVAARQADADAARVAAAGRRSRWAGGSG